eukprot:TRINITY_DN316_c0_g1_i1.p1 TRINITY_DN316_c0_g1~~TRINITY_DN316_c0_g1_i1.p1  ORF type:complete len:277 (+),score=57.77 TRINITY_DN316_c0_g1_i1:67-831(+)
MTADGSSTPTLPFRSAAPVAESCGHGLHTVVESCGPGLHTVVESCGFELHTEVDDDHNGAGSVVDGTESWQDRKLLKTHMTLRSMQNKDQGILYRGPWQGLVGSQEEMRLALEEVKEEPIWWRGRKDERLRKTPRKDPLLGVSPEQREQFADVARSLEAIRAALTASTVPSCWAALNNKSVMVLSIDRDNDVLVVCPKEKIDAQVARAVAKGVGRREYARSHKPGDIHLKLVAYYLADVLGRWFYFRQRRPRGK